MCDQKSGEIMEKYTLSKIFLSIYRNMSSFQDKKLKYFEVEDIDLLEKTLEEYIDKIMGFPVTNRYNNYKLGRTQTFEYFSEISKYFENIIVNGKFNDFNSAIQCIKDYGDSFYTDIDKYKYVSLFIKASKQSLSNDEFKTYVSQNNKMYKIGAIPEKNSVVMPLITINDIELLDSILEKYINTIKESDSYFNRVFTESIFLNEEDIMQYIFFWALKNATPINLSNCEAYFSKYCTFLTDDTFAEYKEHPKYIGNLLGDELYLYLKKSSVAYETPYYLSFMMKNKRIELPNIRMGIEDNGTKKIAHILATQTSQNQVSHENDQEITEVTKRMLPRSKYFREYNPSHLVSIVLTLGLLNNAGIKEIEMPDYLPLRYQRFVLEEKKSEDELYDYQHRLTNKFLNTFFRLLETVDGITIESYPEMNCPFKIRLDDELVFNNEFLQKIYNITANLNDDKKLSYHLTTTNK
jgi:hypothetical protein